MRRTLMITRVIIANNSICPSLMILKMINGGQASVKAKVLSYISQIRHPTFSITQIYNKPSLTIISA